MSFITWLTSSYIGKLVATFLISMLPIIELRGGIPYGVGFGLNPWVAYIVAVLGNLLPVPFILWFIDKIIAWMKTREGFFNKAATFLEDKVASKKGKVEKYKLFGLLIFVAIPLPGTGAWTGALIASGLRMKFKWAFLSILGGVIIAGFIMTAISYGFVSIL